MAAIGTATVKVNVVPGEDLETAIRNIVRREIEVIAQRAADHVVSSGYVPLQALAMQALIAQT